MTMKHATATTLAPAPPPRFSQGVRRGPLLQTAGQVGTDPATGESAGDDIIRARTAGGVLPARPTVVVGFAAPSILVEIDALAVVAE